MIIKKFPFWLMETWMILSPLWALRTISCTKFCCTTLWISLLQIYTSVFERFMELFSSLFCPQNCAIWLPTCSDLLTPQFPGFFSIQQSLYFKHWLPPLCFTVHNVRSQKSSQKSRVILSFIHLFPFFQRSSSALPVLQSLKIVVSFILSQFLVFFKMGG